uniref:Uncharacterized protein n=1 Tax=Dendroctonus ponderosae TaxID=77166 RepID=A0AAR5P2M1_DENPD
GYGQIWEAHKETQHKNSLQAHNKDPRMFRPLHRNFTKRSVATRIEEHRQNCKLGHVEKSAVTEDVLSDGTHNIYFGEAQVLATTTGYRPRLIREAIEIYKHDDNFNRNEETVVLNKIRFPALTNGKTARKSHSSRQERGSSTPEDMTTSSQPVHKYGLRLMNRIRTIDEDNYRLPTPSHKMITRFFTDTVPIY